MGLTRTGVRQWEKVGLGLLFRAKKTNIIRHEEYSAEKVINATENIKETFFLFDGARQKEKERKSFGCVDVLIELVIFGCRDRGPPAAVSPFIVAIYLFIGFGQ